jgi:hypothetical protein
MSGNRANAAAIQRRNPQQQQQQQPMMRQNPVQQQQRGNIQSQRASSLGQPTTKQYIKQEKIQDTPKLSVSDAFALVTLRLGRVESFINEMPSLEQLNSSCANETSSSPLGENDRVIDEAVFTSIVSRLDKIEKIPEDVVDVKYITMEMYNELNTSIDVLKNLLSINETNTKLLNQQLLDFITSTNEISKEKSIEPLKDVDLEDNGEIATSDLSNITNLMTIDGTTDV